MARSECCSRTPPTHAYGSYELANTKRGRMYSEEPQGGGASDAAAGAMVCRSRSDSFVMATLLADVQEIDDSFGSNKSTPLLVEDIYGT
jgi:hypothetical protein